MSLNHTTIVREPQLRRSLVEAERFINRVEAALTSIENNTYDSSYSPEYAAVKRASMDLQRTLVDLRKTPYLNAISHITEGY